VVYQGGYGRHIQGGAARGWAIGPDPLTRSGKRVWAHGPAPLRTSLATRTRPPRFPRARARARGYPATRDLLARAAVARRPAPCFPRWLSDRYPFRARSAERSCARGHRKEDTFPRPSAEKGRCPGEFSVLSPGHRRCAQRRCRAAPGVQGGRVYTQGVPRVVYREVYPGWWVYTHPGRHIHHSAQTALGP